MRITIEIPESVLEHATIAASEMNLSLEEFILDSIRRRIYPEASSSLDRNRLRLPVILGSPDGPEITLELIKKIEMEDDIRRGFSDGLPNDL